jgi:hypothetical protein
MEMHFLREKWSPWFALVRMRERWPGLRFDMRAGPPQVNGYDIVALDPGEARLADLMHRL